MILSIDNGKRWKSIEGNLLAQASGVASTLGDFRLGNLSSRLHFSSYLPARSANVIKPNRLCYYVQKGYGFMENLVSVTVSTFLIFMFVDQLLLVFVDQLLLNFDGAETLGEILESEGKQRFVRLFVVNDCGWRDFASSRIISRRLGLNNCVRYRFNRPRLYLTVEHSIRWKFCLSKTQPIFEDQRKLTTCRGVQKCTEESFSKCREMYRKNYIESHLGG